MNEMISIYMLAYNHEKFIAKAIDSIVNQSIDVPYKLYVHDDASTDNTADIIREYAKKYPDIVVPIIESKNMYSETGVVEIRKILLKEMKGEYVCCCEGDDFWIDSDKLRLQFEYMSKHLLCTYCFTNGIMVDIEGKYLSDFFKSHYWKDEDIIHKLKQDSDFSFEEMLRIGFTPTASIMMRRSAFEEACKCKYQLDLSTRLVTTYIGYAHFINIKTTAYRLGNPNSASGKASLNFEKYIEDFCDYHKKIYEEIDAYTNFEYHKTIQKEIDRERVLAYVRFLKRNNYSEFIKLPAYSQLRLCRKIRWLLKVALKG